MTKEQIIESLERCSFGCCVEKCPRFTQFIKEYGWNELDCMEELMSDTLKLLRGEEDEY